MEPTQAPYLADSLTGRIGEFIQLRRDLHAHPELAFQEHRTAALVADKLAGWGYEVTTGIGGTGVVGRLRRGRDSGKALGIRADMDALPITEPAGRAWASRTAGVMHACGHDGHTATLLAAARLIAQDVAFDGTLHLIFQPAEEGAAGARRMMDDGLFERFPCDMVYALHNIPGLEAGHFYFRHGSAMASSDHVTIRLRGIGGHAAMPHAATDPVVAAAALVMALQSVVSRNVNPLQTAVVTVGALHAGSANNVIPHEATMELSVRALDPQVRVLLKERIHALAQMQAASFQVTAEVDWREGYPVLVNAAEPTRIASQVARELFGHDRVHLDAPPLTASEDFAFMLEQVPGCYVLVGNGGPGTPGACMVHNPGYDFNDEIIEPASRLWAGLVGGYLKG
ncbi:amidohydrolase [Ramlibacter sp. AW1]|uniref:Amidohydrolase n=1 Tax=Ramlibacter aurantiacus TaxID=2801330 RepID=A0A936ZKQ1_9BURK|nr:M20 aminoacylase family protein [Ramlibacter aurantiacus]MBL0419073.1 amidohydrolase [Ramlibacter aurantiacus]